MAFLFNPLHYALHHAVRWDFATVFDFARNDGYVPIARSEVRSLAQHVPILVAITGSKAVAVVPIDPQHATHAPLDEAFRWRHGTAPTALRYHPFRAIADSTTGAPILAVAEDRVTVNTTATNGFFDDNAQPLPVVRAVLRRLQQLESEKSQMRAAASALAEAGLLVAMPHLTDRRGRAPFHTLDSSAFAALPPARLATLGPLPHHAFMLAASMAYSRQWLPADFAANEAAPITEVIARRPAAGAFVMEEEEFVLNFDT